MGEPTEAAGDFFSSDEAELREETRTRLDRAAIEIQERLRTDDVSIPERVKALGFDGETSRIFDLVPMVQKIAIGNLHPGRIAIVRLRDV